MRRKQVEIDRLVITSNKNVESVIADFLKRHRWKKINGNTYRALLTLYVKIERDNNDVIVDIWEKSISGVVTSRKTKLYHFMTPIQINFWIKRWTKEMKKIDPNCKILRTYTTIETNMFFFPSILIILAVLGVLALLILKDILIEMFF